MIEKTEAITLRVSPFSRTSHVVSWLTPEFGRIATVIKGACRPKSQFLGQYDLFYTCELLFYTRERNNLHIAKECSPINTRSAFRTNWRAACCASYICDLVQRVTLQGHHQSEVYDLTASTLDHLCSSAPNAPFLFWFELKLLHTLGLSPQFTKCPTCNRKLTNQGSVAFSHQHGGALCHACAKRETGNTITIGPDVLAMLKTWQAAPSPTTALRTQCTTNQIAGFKEVPGIFLPYHLDWGTIPASRAITLEMLSFDGA